ncbi:hypothetical protein C8R45DRAFT_1022544 [Mycena sanguinolenta]|nr:hypothetical protein C8R45DRAFT_1022544 [Mycena sanguinolenta]
MCVLHSLHCFHFRFLFCTTSLSVALTALLSPLRAYAAFVTGRDGVRLARGGSVFLRCSYFLCVRCGGVLRYSVRVFATC